MVVFTIWRHVNIQIYIFWYNLYSSIIYDVLLKFYNNDYLFFNGKNAIINKKHTNSCICCLERNRMNRPNNSKFCLIALLFGLQ